MGEDGMEKEQGNSFGKIFEDLVKRWNSAKRLPWRTPERMVAELFVLYNALYLLLEELAKERKSLSDLSAVIPTDSAAGILTKERVPFPLRASLGSVLDKDGRFILQVIGHGDSFPFGVEHFSQWVADSLNNAYRFEQEAMDRGG